MTEEQFRLAADISAGLAARWYPHLVATFREFALNLPQEKAMFIAQVGHESASFTSVIESFNYSAEGLLATFGQRLTAEQCQKLGRSTRQSANQREIAEQVYGGRMGNKLPGDGWKYCGRGLIQITGADNYRACGNALQLNLLNNPELLQQEINATRSAGWFWQSRNCSRYATDIARVTQLINGGNKGLADRSQRYQRACQVLK